MSEDLAEMQSAESASSAYNLEEYAVEDPNDELDDLMEAPYIKPASQFELNKEALKMSGDARWKFVFALCCKVKRCGDDSEDGCGTLQPSKIRKEGLATIFAEWKTANNQEAEPIIIKVTPEMILKNFKRIS